MKNIFTQEKMILWFTFSRVNVNWLRPAIKPKTIILAQWSTLKKIVSLMSTELEPTILSHDTGQ